MSGENKLRENHVNEMIFWLIIKPFSLEIWSSRCQVTLNSLSTFSKRLFKKVRWHQKCNKKKSNKRFWLRINIVLNQSEGSEFKNVREHQKYNKERVIKIE
jgi:hypothetical protein